MSVAEQPNIMSVELTEWAEIAACVKSPVASNLASLLWSMSQLSDPELLSLQLPVLKQKVTVWDSSKHDYNDALDLPKGRLYADFGFFVEQSVCLDTLAKVINQLKERDIAITATTQAGILVNAQQNGLLENWAKLSLC
jgi:hypothetical protein